MKKILSFLLALCLTLPLFLFNYANASAETSSGGISRKPSIGVEASSGGIVGPGISGIVKGSLAEKAGMAESDIIIAVGGVKVKNKDDVVAAWNSYLTGNKIEFELYRRGRKYTTEVTKTESSLLGIYLNELSIGALVESVKSGGPAFKAGIEKGDLIVALNGRTVTTPLSIEVILKDCKVKDIVDIEYLRDDYLNTAKITLGPSKFGISEILVLASEVNSGESVPLLSVNAIGNIELDKGFSWFHDDKSDLLVSLAKENSKIGVRIENTYDDELGIYTSTLWADNIKTKASGDYYCYVTDRMGSPMETSRVNIKVY